MPPKRRVPPKTGPKKLQAIPVVLDAEAQEQLRNELEWTISQLQLKIQNAKKQEQVDKWDKVITTLSTDLRVSVSFNNPYHLGSENTPVPKKRILMRQYFPNYRALMEKDLLNWEKETVRMEADANFSSSSTKRGHVVNSRRKSESKSDSAVAESIEKLSLADSGEPFKWQTTNESFSFNFTLPPP